MGGALGGRQVVRGGDLTEYETFRVRGSGGVEAGLSGVVDGAGGAEVRRGRGVPADPRMPVILSVGGEQLERGAGEQGADHGASLFSERRHLLHHAPRVHRYRGCIVLHRVQ